MMETIVQLSSIVVQKKTNAQTLVGVLTEFQIGMDIATRLVVRRLLRVPSADMACGRNSGKCRAPMAAIGTLTAGRGRIGLVVRRLRFLSLGNVMVIGALVSHLHVLLGARIGGIVGRKLERTALGGGGKLYSGQMLAKSTLTTSGEGLDVPLRP